MTRSFARSSLLLAVLAAACGGSTPSNGSGSAAAGADAGPTPADAGTSGFVAISLSQTDVRIQKFMMTAFAVTALRADGSKVDVTEQASAQSSNPKVATVDHGQGAQMLIHSQAEEVTAVVTVTHGDLTADCKVTVFSD
jgi:hypothetical protein